MLRLLFLSALLLWSLASAYLNDIFMKTIGSSPVSYERIILSTLICLEYNEIYDHVWDSIRFPASSDLLLLIVVAVSQIVMSILV